MNCEVCKSKEVEERFLDQECIIDSNLNPNSEYKGAWCEDCEHFTIIKEIKN